LFWRAVSFGEAAVVVWRAVSFGEAAVVVWRAVSFGEAAVVVLVVDYRYPFCLCVCMYMERCAVGPRPQGLLERPGEDFFLFYLIWGAVGGWP
jgi:hypothetical protein